MTYGKSQSVAANVTSRLSLGQDQVIACASPEKLKETAQAAFTSFVSCEALMIISGLSFQRCSVLVLKPCRRLPLAFRLVPASDFCRKNLSCRICSVVDGVLVRLFFKYTTIYCTVI